MRQLHLFLCALQFMTRLPTPRLTGFEQDWIVRASPYYPLVGWIVGAISAIALLASSHFWSGPVPATMAVTTGWLVTGGFHEDGLADTADGLGGGQTPTRRFEIMKDSRIGSYGGLALWSSLALKVAALSLLTPIQAACALVLIHGAARSASVVVMVVLPYAGDPEAAKLKPAPLGVSPVEAAVAVSLGLAPLLILAAPSSVVISIALAGSAVAILVLVARRLIGGYTGDVLGAVEQLAEIALLLGLSARLPLP